MCQLFCAQLRMKTSSPVSPIRLFCDLFIIRRLTRRQNGVVAVKHLQGCSSGHARPFCLAISLSMRGTRQIDCVGASGGLVAPSSVRERDGGVGGEGGWWSRGEKGSKGGGRDKRSFGATVRGGAVRICYKCCEVWSLAETDVEMNKAAVTNTMIRDSVRAV